ncbi:MAG: SH3 domain-containing protein [Clostridiales bacterium]|nr:SH3 domain-containing protein [Clostridiales bacterium]
MSRSKRAFYMLSGIVLVFALLMSVNITAAAGENAAGSKEYLDSLSVGVAKILTPSTEVRAENGMPGNTTENKTEDNNTAITVSGNTVQETETETITETKSDLVMADVQNALNVRSEANEDSEKVGLLYKDCGGKILERKDGWTKLKSGDLVGWANDEYLLFNEDAERLAGEVGNLIVTIETDALRVRKEPSTDADIYVLMAQDDELDVIEVLNDDWISVAYEDKVGYVSSEFVDLDFHIDEGETVAAIKAREKAEAEAKAKLTANQGAVVVGADDTRLLAALIYCEAGNQGYEGHLAVGAVVMNRVRSGAYPNSITGVIYASGQFTPALNGKVAKVYAGNIPESCIKAAQDAIGGSTNVGTATHFRRAGVHDGIVIGDHVFW